MGFDMQAAILAAVADEMSMTWCEFVGTGGRVHTRAACRASRKEGAPKNCVIHNPSKHKMRDWPLVLRSSGLLERQCPHGVGHPDPDSARYMNWRYKTDSWWVHGCHLDDSGRLCCAPDEKEK